MIKTSSLAPAPASPTRASPASQVEARGGEREGRPGAFSEVLDSHAARAETERVEDRADTQDAPSTQGDEDSGPSGIASGNPAQGPAEPLQASQAATSAGTTTAPSFAALETADGSAIASSAPATAPVTDPFSASFVPPAVVAPASARPVPATPELSEPRLGLEQELQKQLALGSVAPQSTAALTDAFASEGRTGDRDGLSMGGTVATAPSLLTAEMRPSARSPSADAAPTPARAPELRAPLGTAAWGDELGARLTWMVERGEQVASLRLSPENLGPVEVRIAVREGETSVWFGAASADARAALEQSLPRLREMLGASGLALANAGVSSQTPRDPQRGFTAAALARAAQESGADTAGGIVMQVSNRGLVDLYA